jgi:hypothetical protein
MIEKIFKTNWWLKSWMEHEKMSQIESKKKKSLKSFYIFHIGSNLYTHTCTGTCMQNQLSIVCQVKIQLTEFKVDNFFSCPYLFCRNNKILQRYQSLNLTYEWAPDDC